MNSARPIGVFDSGLGGLTVLRELQLRMPNESFIYLGDTARLPYGTKSPEVIKRYSARCLEFLAKREVKCAVVACNTASSVGLDYLQSLVPYPVFGVVEPGVQAAAAATAGGGILVLATATTVNSHAYANGLKTLLPNVPVHELACPILVSLVEEGWWEGGVTEGVIRRYLDQVAPFSYDTVVLGCTHFPLLERSFTKVLNRRAGLVQGAPQLADQMLTFLRHRGALSPSLVGETVQFYATDRVSREQILISRLFPAAGMVGLVDL